MAVCRRDWSSEIDFLLAELDEGEMFDAIAWLTRKRRAAPVVAVEVTTSSMLDQAEREQRLEEHPAAARAMTGGASQQARVLRLVTEVSNL